MIVSCFDCECNDCEIKRDKECLIDGCKECGRDKSDCKVNGVLSNERKLM